MASVGLSGLAETEFSLTQIWDQAVSGRCFFEEVIRENIDLGRPEQVQLIFSRKLKKSTVADGRCRTRIINEGVIPSLHIYYKNTHSKQYHKAAKRRARDCAPRRPLTTPMTSVLAGVCATCPPYGRSALEPIAAYWK